MIQEAVAGPLTSRLAGGGTQAGRENGARKREVDQDPPRVIESSATEQQFTHPFRLDFQKRQQEFRDVMREKGYTLKQVELNGQMEWAAEWPGMLEDFQMMDDVFDILDSDRPDADVNEQLLGELSWNNIALGFGLSEELSKLSQGGIVKHNNETPTQHIQLVFHELKTDADGDVEQRYRDAYADERRLLRWGAYSHDLGKTIDPNNPMHAVASKAMMVSYLKYREAKAVVTGQELSYDQEFVKKLLFLIEYHHFFAEIGSHFLTPEATQVRTETLSNLKKDPGDKIRIKLNLVNSLKGLFTRRLGSVHEYEDQKVVDAEAVFAAFPELEQDPNYLELLYKMTVADVSSNKNYSHHNILNKTMYKALRSYLIQQLRQKKIDSYEDQ